MSIELHENHQTVLEDDEFECFDSREDSFSEDEYIPFYGENRDHSFNGEQEVSSVSASRKRRYCCTVRKRKEATPLNRRTDWLEFIETMNEPKFRRMVCCKSFKCFKVADYNHTIDRARYVLSASGHIRRATLNSIMSSDGSFHFNGKEVCVRFLKGVFRFSTGLIAEVRASLSSDQRQNEIGSQQHFQPSFTSSSSRPLSSPKPAPQKEAVISFLTRLAEDCSNNMPDRNEVHLPFFNKGEVYSLFHREYKFLYCNESGSTRSTPRPSYFFWVWKHNCKDIKVRKASRFTICDECEEIRAALRHAVTNGKSTAALLSRADTHRKFVADERLEYQKKKDRAKIDPSEQCSIIVDGADQHAFGIPHFITKTKSQKGFSLKVKLIGLLEHGVNNNLHLYTMTEDHETGANHIIETVHRFINDRRTKGPLPPKFFVQVDNCSRENKNHFFMAYMESLVALGVFKSVEVGFLPKGHTHEDIDQCFSQTSGRLKIKNAITLADLQSELTHTNKGQAKVYHLKRVVNWRGLCEQERCMRRVDNLTQYHYFRFSLGYAESDNLQLGPVSTTCHVRHSCRSQWQPLFMRKKKSSKGITPSGILKFCPDLRKVPSLNISCPDNAHKVTERFESEEGRINDSDKMISLYELRDFVYQDRTDKFHWDLTTAVETKFCGIYRQSQEQLDANDDTSSMAVHNDDEVENDSSSDNECDEIQPEQTISIPSEDIKLKESMRERQELSNKKEKGERIQAPSSKVTYNVGSFVATRKDDTLCDTTHPSFWVAKIVDVFTNPGETFARKLKVHWFDTQENKNDENLLISAFYPCYNSRSRDSKKKRKTNRSDLQVAWTDTIDTDAVIMMFDGLTKRNRLPLCVQKRLARQ